MDKHNLIDLAVRRAEWLAALDQSLTEAQGAARLLSRNPVVSNEAGELLARLRQLRHEVDVLRGVSPNAPKFPLLWI